MRFPWLDTLLSLLIVAGACCVWQSGSERLRLQPEYERFKRLTGELIPQDPAKVYVRALPTDDPLEFAWRVYLPANYRLQVHHESGSSSGSSSDPVNTIARVRLKEIDGTWRVYKKVAYGSSLSSLPPKVGKFLSEHPEQLQVEQLGRGTTAEFSTSDSFVLLQLTAAAEGRSAGDSNQKDSSPPKPFIKLQIGPPK